jgi:hypothetical protein
MYAIFYYINNENGLFTNEVAITDWKITRELKLKRKDRSEITVVRLLLRSDTNPAASSFMTAFGRLLPNANRRRCKSRKA